MKYETAEDVWRKAGIYRARSENTGDSYANDVLNRGMNKELNLSQRGRENEEYASAYLAYRQNWIENIRQHDKANEGILHIKTEQNLKLPNHSIFYTQREVIDLTEDDNKLERQITVYDPNDTMYNDKHAQTYQTSYIAKRLHKPYDDVTFVERPLKRNRHSLNNTTGPGACLAISTAMSKIYKEKKDESGDIAAKQHLEQTIREHLRSARDNEPTDKQAVAFIKNAGLLRMPPSAPQLPTIIN